MDVCISEDQFWHLGQQGYFVIILNHKAVSATIQHECECNILHKGVVRIQRTCSMINCINILEIIPT